ncbi:type II secretion system F family protein [Trujillonella endophytica]|uniref:Tight adherence protein B n=1 Tax=Trujillonella endophytica TaxID=673521 RepID=A0A1H8WJL2_9ACTN|nr:type II secretion system F family protein [Trujillella endophytica]SEP27884.1 tight adherence protein B [Trujillella endophytica]
MPLLLAAGALLLWPAGRSRGRLPAVRRPVAWGSRLPAVAAAAAALAAATTSTPLVAVLAAACVGGAVLARQRSRREEVEEQRVDALTEALGALAAELRSGRAMADAAAAAGAACADPAGADALVRAVRAPASVPAAGPDAGAGEVAVARLASAVRLSVRTGCSLAAVTGAVEDDLRARRRHRLELRTALAGPRASAALLAGLPVLALLMGSGVGADPWGVLTTTGSGQVLLVVGVALEGAGLLWTGWLVRRAAR